MPGVFVNSIQRSDCPMRLYNAAGQWQPAFSVSYYTTRGSLLQCTYLVDT